MPPLISLSLAAAAIEPVLPGAATSALAWLAGWCAWWIALVARVVAELAVGARSGRRVVIAGRGRARRERSCSSADAALPPAHRCRELSFRSPSQSPRLRARCDRPPAWSPPQRAARHVPRRRPGRFGPARGARRRGARGRGAARGGRRGPASPARSAVADRDRPHAPAARSHRRRRGACSTGCSSVRLPIPGSRRRPPTTTRQSPLHAPRSHRSSSCTRARSFRIGRASPQHPVAGRARACRARTRTSTRSSRSRATGRPTCCSRPTPRATSPRGCRSDRSRS